MSWYNRQKRPNRRYLPQKCHKANYTKWAWAGPRGTSLASLQQSKRTAHRRPLNKSSGGFIGFDRSTQLRIADLATMKPSRRWGTRICGGFQMWATRPPAHHFKIYFCIDRASTFFLSDRGASSAGKFDPPNFWRPSK